MREGEDTDKEVGPSVTSYSGCPGRKRATKDPGARNEATGPMLSSDSTGGAKSPQPSLREERAGTGLGALPSL